MVHGLASHRIAFTYLGWKLRQAGFATRAFGYRSIWKTIEQHADALQQAVEAFDRDPRWSKIHFLSHSMGGIVTRQMLLDYRPEKLGRLVMLSSPNQGSPAATFLSQRVFTFSKTLAQLSDEPDSYVCQLSFPDDVDVGVVHAKVDRVVSRESSLPFPDAPIVEIDSGHNDLLVRPSVAKQVESFLLDGQFVLTP